MTTILLADDHTLVRQGLRLILAAEPDFEVVADVGDGRAAVEYVTAHPVDLAILDITMPELSGLQAARRILAVRPTTKVLILSMHNNDQYLVEALRLGAAGYVHKSSADHELVAACRAALAGETFLHPGAVTTLVREFVQRRTDDIPTLSAREEEVLKLIAEGHTGREIAEMLFLSPKTVERHRTNILDKLGMRDRVELTRYAIRMGLIQP